MERQNQLRSDFATVRAQSLALIDGLTAEDCQLQSMIEASPLKWHLAHVTWFFETFVLERAEVGFTPFRPEFRVLFNSYYVGVGAIHPRAERGLLSRPGLDEVIAYRNAVDRRMEQLMTATELELEVLNLIELGLNHEQQHQELMLTDLKHHFSRNPLLPAYRPQAVRPGTTTELAEMIFQPFAGGHVRIGHGGNGFAFDNETPRHGVWLEPFSLANRLVSNGEYLQFIEDGGYARPELWLSEGWDCQRREGWNAPLYWQQRKKNEWSTFTLQGEQPLDTTQPVCHASYYEADAYARWARARLPTEAEWEYVAQIAWAAGPPLGNLLDDGVLQPHPASIRADGIEQLFGDVWEWMQSAYLPYPGYRPSAGAIGEYNGKFMINQMVLRGGSFATRAAHIRPSYRNFFPPGARWQFSGIRLARSSLLETPALLSR